MQDIHVLKVHGAVERVWLDAADVVRLHAVQRLHQVAQLALEAAAHAGKLVAALLGPAPAGRWLAVCGGVSIGGEEQAHKLVVRSPQQLLVLGHHKVAVLGEEVVGLVRHSACRGWAGQASESGRQAGRQDGRQAV